MTLYPRFLKCAFVAWSLLSVIPAARGQSLYDVLASLSDRHRVLVQQTQVQAWLKNTQAGENLEIPEDAPITWKGLGGGLSEVGISSLSVGGRIALTNQAVAEFERIARSYLNVSPAELGAQASPGSGKPEVGSIQFYLPGDFPPLPRATPENQAEILRQLALRVRALRVLPWPSAFETVVNASGSAYAREEEAYDENDEPIVETDDWGMDPLAWEPASIGPINVEPHAHSSHFSVSETSNASLTVNGSYNEDTAYEEDLTEPLKTQTLSYTTSYPKKAVVSATAPGAEGAQIDGTVRIISRSRWSEFTLVGATERFDPGTGAYVIEGGESSGDIGLIPSTPAMGVQGAWATISSGENYVGPWVRKTFVPTGYQFKGDSLISTSDPEDAGKFAKSYEQSWTVGCRFFSVFEPEFSRGVDAAAAASKIDSASLALAVTGSDGAFTLYPRPGLLFGIDMGPGLNGAGSGMLTTIAMAGAHERDFASIPYSMPGTGTFGEDVYPVVRFDSSYGLRFGGSSVDYHVVYDNDRLTRTQHLPDLAWPFGSSSYDSETLLRDWDRSRLKQVVSRDLVAEVTYNVNHYGGYTVTVYRRSKDAPAPVATTTVDTSSLPVARVWTFSKPGIGAEAHPADPEKLQALGTAGEKYEIAATHDLIFHGAGWGYRWDYSYAMTHHTTAPWWWWHEGDYQWNFKLSDASGERRGKEVSLQNTLQPDESLATHTMVKTYLDEQLTGTLESNSLDPFDDASPSDWTYVAAGKTIVGTPAPADDENSAFRYGKLATSLGIDYDGVRPDLDATWDDNGLLDLLVEGAWKTDGAPEGQDYKVVRKFNDQTIATEWFEFTGSAALKHYSAPDGANVAKGHASVAWTEVEMGTLSAGQPGLPRKVGRSDDTGTTFAWTIGPDGAGSVVTSDGLLSGGSVTKGTEVTSEWNQRGFTTSASGNLLLGGNLKTSGAAVPSGEYTDWAMPLKWKDDFSTVASSWTFDGNRSRISSETSTLGQTTALSGYDVLDRPGSISANGITASNTFTGLTTKTDYDGNDIQTGTKNTTIRDALGRLTSSNTTWNGVADNLGLTHGGTTLDVTRTVGSYGTETSEIRQSDGSLQKADGPTLPFDGVSGDGLTVANGLLVSRTEILDEQGQDTGTFEETHTDAWGRVRKVVTPSKSGGAVSTTISYSNPNASLQRVITTEASGRALITESDPYNSSGAISRSGIDVNKNGSLGEGDRYTESLTNVVGTTKLVTTLKVTDEPGPGVTGGMRKVMRSEWTASTGVTETWINGDEEKITTTPNKANKTVETTSTKGWTRNTTLNSLGLPTTNTLSGSGIATTGLTPVWRADGSLESVSMSIGGETHSAGFNANGTLSSLIVPGRGNILGGHTIANGKETLTVDGVTVESRLDGTENETSGGNVVGRMEKLTAEGGFKLTVTPELGEDTVTQLSAALAPTSKTYADASGESLGYTGELLTSVSLARGGAMALVYSADSAKDLASATWPTVVSGPFTIPGLAHGFTYNRAGQIKTLTDPSGARSLAYQNGRLTSTAYTAGQLRGYEIIRNHNSGSHTGTLVKRDGADIHTVSIAPNGAFDQITELASGGITATPQRDAAGRITGYIWSGGGSNSVTQTWERGAGGRIEFAGSDVLGAPSFDYLLDPNDPGESFDVRNRRLKCATAGDIWTYTYGLNGQLTSASHPTLGSFSYGFDAIGRRTDKGSANTSNLLNQSTAWTNSQNKTLRVNAHPDARVWLGIDNATPAEIPGFNGSYSYPIPSPGASGGWVPWNTLAVLEGQGDAGANPDAKAEKHGAVWIPPTDEILTFDVAGNRQSNAQWDYGWDAKNQLVRSRTKNCIGTPEIPAAPQGYDIAYTYDAEGRRVLKKVIRYQSGSVVEQKIVTFVWDGWDLLYERQQLPSGLTTLERKYLWGPDIADGTAGGAGGLLLIQETKGNAPQKIIPLYDGTGHVVALTNLNKALLASYAYGPFGEKISATGPLANSNPWRWGTKYFDEETGFYYFHNRYYDPLTCQWLSREILGESESVNLYQFAGNDPINFVDVNGLAAKDVRQHVDQAQKQLAQLTLVMASLVGSKDEEFENLSGEIEQIFGRYLGSVTAGQDELSKFMQEGWLLSFRSADDDLVTDLAALPTSLAGMRPDAAMKQQWMRSGAAISSSASSQSTVLGHTHTALVATEVTGNAILISTGVGAGGVAVKQVLLNQGGKQAAKLVARGMAKAGGGIAVGFLSQEAMVAAGVKPEHAQLAMKGAELFFAWKMLKVARMANVANATVRAESSLSGQLLRQDLLRQEAASAFNASGGLSEGALAGSREVIPAAQLVNKYKIIPEGFGKASTRTFQSPSGDFQAHFYRNPTTGEVFNGLDYKIKFNSPPPPLWPGPR